MSIDRIKEKKNKQIFYSMIIWQERRHVRSYKAKFERVGPGKSFYKKTTPGDLFRRLTSTQNLNVLNPLMFY